MTKKYNCDRCNYSTDSRQNFWQHQNRTKKCSVQRLEIESKNNLISSRTCVYCNKVFSTNSNMNRHVNQYCKVRKRREAQLQPHVINNHITNNITNNIHINAFGFENIEHMKKTIQYCLTQDDYIESMKMLTQFTYNDPEHPENHTVMINDDHTKWAKVSNGNGEYERRPKKEVILFVIDKNKSRFDQCMNDIPKMEFTRYGMAHIDSKKNRDKMNDKKIYDTVEGTLINKSMPEDEEVEDIRDVERIYKQERIYRHCIEKLLKKQQEKGEKTKVLQSMDFDKKIDVLDIISEQ